MRKILAYILFATLSLAYAHAETIMLRTGARMNATIVFQNDEVLIVRDAEGARFQFPKADVLEILSEELPALEEQSQTIVVEEEVKTPKKVSAILEISGALAVKPNEAVGASVGADLLIGTHHIGSKHLFIGGGLGYHGVFVGGTNYNFLPVQVAIRMPFIEEKHAPVFGAALGYGVALSKHYLGGLYAGIDFGYRCQLNPKAALAVVAFVQFQQAKMDTREIIEGVQFINKTGCNLVTPGLKLALYF